MQTRQTRDRPHLHRLPHPVRIENAKTLLLDRNRRISEIAYDVGFQSLTHFNRVFKAMTGQSPSGYRLKTAKI
jgi:AraC-like DNA-binding protein